MEAVSQVSDLLGRMETTVKPIQPIYSAELATPRDVDYFIKKIEDLNTQYRKTFVNAYKEDGTIASTMPTESINDMEKLQDLRNTINGLVNANKKLKVEVQQGMINRKNDPDFSLQQKQKEVPGMSAMPEKAVVKESVEVKTEATEPDQVDMIMSYEQGDLSDEDTLELFSRLIKSGLAWKLQGSYGRTAKALIDAGRISSKGDILETEAKVETKELMSETSNVDVIDMFLSDSFPKDKLPSWGTANLKITKQPKGWVLVNYATPILYRENGSDRVLFNTQKYSPTTSKIQTGIREMARSKDVKLTEVNEEGIRKEI